MRRFRCKRGRQPRLDCFDMLSHEAGRTIARDQARTNFRELERAVVERAPVSAKSTSGKKPRNLGFLGCRRRLIIDPPFRLIIDPGPVAVF